jgi:hypothetical protein
MEIVFLAGMALLALLIIIVIIKMLANRLRGKDELDGLLSFKHPKKDNEKLQ